MVPVLALIGRPNVGKSTLFNRLTKTRDAIVGNQPGITRDRLYGTGRVGVKPYIVVDTGGFGSDKEKISILIRKQVDQVLQEAQAILFIVDSQCGLINQDKEIAEKLRKINKNLFLVINKIDGLEDPELVKLEFYELAIGTPNAVSAKRGDGVESLIDRILVNFNHGNNKNLENCPKVALVGRQNVGKSTLTNQLVGKYRVIVNDESGTTRDQVRIPITSNNQNYILIDTAGIRRRSKVDQVIEKFSIVKTLQAIAESNVVLLTIDTFGEIHGQDATIAGMIRKLGRSMVVVVNKWDRFKKYNYHRKKQIKKDIEHKLIFLRNTEFLFVSALNGSNVGDVFPAVQRAYQAATVSIPTSSLNRTLAKAIFQTPPPMYHQRVVKLKFAHQAGKTPPVIVIHGNQSAAFVQESYRTYLANFFIRAYKLVGTPIKIIISVNQKSPSKFSMRVRRESSVKRNKL